MTDNKFKSLVHFIVHECLDQPGRLGAIRLNKALWYSDVHAFKQNGVSITGSKYVKRARGPVPSQVLPVLRSLQEEGKILIVEPAATYDTRKFISLQAPEAEALSDDERELAKSILESVCGHTANEISELTHDNIWAAAQEGEEIPIYATLASELGIVDDDVVDWAKSVIEEIKRAA